MTEISCKIQNGTVTVSIFPEQDEHPVNLAITTGNGEAEMTPEQARALAFALIRAAEQMTPSEPKPVTYGNHSTSDDDAQLLADVRRKVAEPKPVTYGNHSTGVSYEDMKKQGFLR